MHLPVLMYDVTLQYRVELVLQTFNRQGHVTTFWRLPLGKYMGIGQVKKIPAIQG